MSRWDRSLIEWDENDFREEGMLTRKALDGASHPLLNPCRNPHSWDLDQEEGVIYLYCTKCQTTFKLDKDKVYARIPQSHF